MVLQPVMDHLRFRKTLSMIRSSAVGGIKTCILFHALVGMEFLTDCDYIQLKIKASLEFRRTIPYHVKFKLKQLN
jgi:hypothetical protein